MATLKDVAREAGVAISTVSRAFTHPERLSADTVAHVRKVAEELNYRVNPMAKALITGTSPVIGMLVTDLSTPYMNALVKAAQAEAFEQGHWLVVGDSDEIPEREIQWSTTVSGLTHGLILAAPRCSDSELHKLADQGRMLLVQRAVPGIASIRQDSTAAYVDLIDHLAGLGHTRLGYLPGPESSRIGVSRIAMVTSIAAERGLDLHVFPHTGPGLIDGLDLTADVLGSGVTAALCFADPDGPVTGDRTAPPRARRPRRSLGGRTR